MSEAASFLNIVMTALERGKLTPDQAIASCLAFGQATVEKEPFSIDNYWEQQGWLNAEEFGEIENAQFASTFDKLDTIVQDDISLLHSIHSSFPEHQPEQNPPPKAVVPSASQNPYRPQTWVSHDEESLPQKAWKPNETQDASIGQAPITAGYATKVWQPHLEPDKRYEVLDELGRGGLGKVDEVKDANLGRHVARKMLLSGLDASQQSITSFIQEAYITGQLEHPNIIPLYEIGTVEDGQYYYTMRMVSSYTLLQAMHDNELSLVQYIRIVQEICMGLEYAHSRGVTHRDIKPANVILGEFGEVLIIDWGLAEISADNPLSLAPQFRVERNKGKSFRGTPHYLAPEAIQHGTFSPAVDQYAVGVILYQILTGTLPFTHKDFFSLIFTICNKPLEPPTERTPEREIPAMLERICLRMLEKDPNKRFASCREVHTQLEEFLEGTKERERRHLKAEERIDEAYALRGQWMTSQIEVAEKRREWEALEGKVEPWSALEKQQELWAQEDALREAETREAQEFAEIVQKYIQALDHEPRNERAREGLSDVYWDRFLEAEQKRDTRQLILYRDLVLLYDTGKYRRLLESDVLLSFSVKPKYAQIQLYRYTPKQRRLEPRSEWEELSSPLSLGLSSGSYLLEVSCEGYRSVRYPAMLQRGKTVHSSLQLFREDEVGESYVHIPAGEFLYGGDDEAEMSQPVRSVHINDFFMSRYPITFREYLAFLNELHVEDPKSAQQMLPRSGQETYANFVEAENRYVPNRASLFHGDIALRYPKESEAEWELPVFGVSWFDAVLYCRWRSKKESRLVTLPTEEQWEKAAGGVDHRIYPWGNEFVATFCKMGLSRPPQELQPEPVGAFPVDESPYGVCDVVGSIGEWTTPLSQEELDALEKDPKIRVFQRGGGWVVSNPKLMRIRTRLLRHEGLPSYNCGIRVVTFPKNKNE